MRLRLTRLLAIPLTLIGPLALSHVWVVDRGIHFKGGKVDFGHPPRHRGLYSFSSMDSEFDSWRPGTEYLGDESSSFMDRRYLYGANDKATIAAYRRALHRVRSRDYAGAITAYRTMLRKGMGSVPQIRYHIAVLKAAAGRDLAGLQDLLAAESILPEGRTRPLPTLYNSGLEPFVRYAEADWDTKHGESRQAARVLFQSARSHLTAPYAEESLIMAARDVLAEDAEPKLDDLHIADASLRLLLRRFPNSRFRFNAHSWLGRIDFLSGRFDDAIRRFGRVLHASPNIQDQQKARESIALCYREMGSIEQCAAWYLKRYSATPRENAFAAMADFRNVVQDFRGATARRFWGLLRKDPELLGMYIDYRMDFTQITPDLLKLGTTGLSQAGRAALPAHVQAKLAEACLTLDRLPDAQTYAKAALVKKPAKVDRDLASFVLGALAMRRGRLDTAEGLYRGIAYGKPATYLTPGAKENLAIIAERTGRLDMALLLYGDMGYKEDFAYLADARMSVDQLAEVTHRSDAPNRKALIYTLGMRYLRLGRWDDAERAFRRLSTHDRRQLTLPKGEEFYQLEDEEGLQDPMATLRALQRLDRASRTARGSEAKAQAMLDMANYYYTHQDLLLYSLPLWHGERAYVIAYSWNTDAATPADDRALARHHQEHECYAHTLEICKEILRKYPRTKAASHAAYRAGVAAEHLANMAPYWRWTDRHVDLLGESIQLLRRAAKSKDPQVAAKAKKYAHVFALSRAEKRKPFEGEAPLTRRWDPRY